MKAITLALVAWVVSASACSAADILLAGNFYVRVHWQQPALLPPRFRNHCTFENFIRPYCANHCGRDYEFYYCSEVSFGCCHLGRGYCDFQGFLRCSP